METAQLFGNNYCPLQAAFIFQYLHSFAFLQKILFLSNFFWNEYVFDYLNFVD